MKEKNETGVSAVRESQAERKERLLREALELPAAPGVYIMHDVSDRVIYVGKSRKLRDRVSQYFRDTEKNRKTERMTASVFRIECIHCDTEIEALTLENTLIKQYSPRYNIKLKDAKSYPYIKLTSGQYPKLVMSRRRLDDGARYFGPYSGTSTVFSVISAVNKVFGLPSCKYRFPGDIGKVRPCIYYQMGQCSGVCTGRVDPEEFAVQVGRAAEVLGGNTAKVRRGLEERMMKFVDEEQFEAAAKCRDTIAALEKLSQKQKAVASPDTDHDVVGVYTDNVCAVLSLLRIRGGALVDKLDYPLASEVIDDSETFITLLVDHYRGSEDIPGRLLLGFECPDDDIQLLAEYLSEKAGKKIPVTIPERGDNRKLCVMACENAREAALKYRRDTEKNGDAAARLAQLLALEVVPSRIEAYDISNIGSEHITAGMIVSEDGRFVRRDYRTFTIKTTGGADDYGAMREALTRRLTHLRNAIDGSAEESGAFAVRPDLILLDGGAQHLSAALQVMEECGIRVPAAGMVKDDFHKTRALVTENGEVSIARERDVFVMIYKLQEEVHRFTVSRMSEAKRRTVRHSSLEKIPGIGPAKAKALLDAFGGIGGLKKATADEIVAVKGINVKDAAAVAEYFSAGSKDDGK